MKWNICPLAAVSLSLAAVSCQDAQPIKPAAQTPKKLQRPAIKPTPAPAPIQPAIVHGKITGVDMGRLFLLKEGGNVLLIDCRPPLFYTLGHIDGAVNLPLKNFKTAYPAKKSLLKNAAKEKKVIVLYCQNLKCPDAYAVAKKLILDGHSVSIYKGGWEEWKRSF